MTQIKLLEKYKGSKFLLFNDDINWKLVYVTDVVKSLHDSINIEILGQICFLKYFESENSNRIEISIANTEITIDDYIDRKTQILNQEQYDHKLSQFLKICTESKSKINKLKNEK